MSQHQKNRFDTSHSPVLSPCRDDVMMWEYIVVD